MCRLSWNLGASASWNPQGLSSPVMGLLYLFVCVTSRCQWSDIENYFKEVLPRHLFSILQCKTIYVIGFCFIRFSLLSLIKRALKRVFSIICHGLANMTEKLLQLRNFLFYDPGYGLSDFMFVVFPCCWMIRRWGKRRAVCRTNRYVCHVMLTKM